MSVARPDKKTSTEELLWMYSKNTAFSSQVNQTHHIYSRVARMFSHRRKTITHFLFSVRPDLVQGCWSNGKQAVKVKVDISGKVSFYVPRGFDQ